MSGLEPIPRLLNDIFVPPFTSLEMTIRVVEILIIPIVFIAARIIPVVNRIIIISASIIRIVTLTIPLSNLLH